MEPRRAGAGFGSSAAVKTGVELPAAMCDLVSAFIRLFLDTMMVLLLAPGDTTANNKNPTALNTTIAQMNPFLCHQLS
jgi:hypothetical protein